MSSDPDTVPPALSPDLTEDAFLDGRLRLRQFRRGHRSGHDAMLLAAATPAQPYDCVVEFGAGAGAAGLALASRIPGIALTLVEIDAALVKLAQDNAALNGIAARAVQLDVAAAPSAFAAAGLPPDRADVVLMNPPFNPGARHQSSPDAARKTAHVAADDTLEAWIAAARRILKPKGMLALIWRTEGLGEVLAALGKGFGGVVVIPIFPDPASPAIRVLVRARKGSRAPMALDPGLVLNDGAGVPTKRAADILGGRLSLPVLRDKV